MIADRWAFWILQFKWMKTEICILPYSHKGTVGSTLLHFNSSHPEPFKHSVPFSQLLRIKLNCTWEEDFLKEYRKLLERLLLQGYTKFFIHKEFNKTKSRTHEELLYKSTEKSSKSNIVRVITKFNKEHKPIRNIITKHWHFLIWRSEHPKICWLKATDYI